MHNLCIFRFKSQKLFISAYLTSDMKQLLLSSPWERGSPILGRDVLKNSLHCPTASALKCNKVHSCPGKLGQKAASQASASRMADCSAAEASLGGPGQHSLQEKLTHPVCTKHSIRYAKRPRRAEFYHLKLKAASVI